MVYKFKRTSGFSGNAEATFNALEEVREQNEGQLKPYAIVDAARPVDSPLHRHFEWSDSKAAENWRSHTARRLVRAVIVKPEKDTPEDNPATHRAYISVQSVAVEGEERVRYYQNINDATQDEFDSAIEQFRSKVAQLRASLRQVERHAKTDHQMTIVSHLAEKTRQIESVVSRIGGCSQ